MTQQKATNITWHEGSVTREERQQALDQKGATIWFTGLSGSGKSTIAVALEQVLLQRGKHAYRLDGDNVRHGLNKNLGFSAEDRAENIRRIGEVAKLFTDAGLVTHHQLHQPLPPGPRHGAASFMPRPTCRSSRSMWTARSTKREKRDPKGLYKKARAGEIKGFTGIDDPYEAPENAELILRSHEQSIEEEIEQLIGLLEKQGLMDA